MMPELETNGPVEPAGRRFPWFCPRCRKRDVWPATIAYRAQRLHEGRNVSVDIPALVVPRCGHCGELVFNYSAEEQIRKALQAQGDSSQDGGATAPGDSSLPAPSAAAPETKQP